MVDQPGNCKTPLGRALRAARLAAQLTTKQLGELLDRSESQVLRWEWGDSEPRSDMMRKLGELYGLTPGQLVDGGVPAAPVVFWEAKAKAEGWSRASR